jgi:hypothetical protein
LENLEIILELFGIISDILEYIGLFALNSTYCAIGTYLYEMGGISPSDNSLKVPF